MELKITAIDNGYVVEYAEDDIIYRNAYKTDDEFNEHENKKEVVRMLYHILETLGEFNQKYDRCNVVVSIAHGRGYDCNEKKCDICGGGK